MSDSANQSTAAELSSQHTNSGNDSAGSDRIGNLTFEGNQILVPLVGLGATLCVLVLVQSFHFLSSLPSPAPLVVSCAPLLLSFVYMGVFVIGKPPRFQQDFFSQLLWGGNIETGCWKVRGAIRWQGAFESRIEFSRAHPLRVIQRRRLTRELRMQGVPKQELNAAVEDLMGF